MERNYKSITERNFGNWQIGEINILLNNQWIREKSQEKLENTRWIKLKAQYNKVYGIQLKQYFEGHLQLSTPIL